MNSLVPSERGTVVREIVSWATEKIKDEAVPDLSLSLHKSPSATTKLYLSQYLRMLALDWERQNRILRFNDELIESLIASLVDKDSEVRCVRDELHRARSALIEVHNEEDRIEAMAEANGNDDVVESGKALVVHSDINAAAGHRGGLLKELAPLILTPLLRMLPNPDSDETAWQLKLEEAERARDELAEKYREVARDHQRTLQQYRKQRKRFAEKSAFLERQIKDVMRENNALLATAAENGHKTAETLGDYVKREQYQVAKEYREFCLRQGMEFLAEEIIACRQSGSDDPPDYLQRMVEIKIRLSEALLIRPYKIQTKRLRTGRQPLGFEAFEPELGKWLVAENIPEAMRHEFRIIAHKAFGLIRELIGLTPACGLLLPECGEPFDADEHEVDAMVCEPDGVVRAIVVPGLLSGHRILMKPVVVTGSA